MVDPVRPDAYFGTISDCTQTQTEIDTALRETINPLFMCL